MKYSFKQVVFLSLTSLAITSCSDNWPGDTPPAQQEDGVPVELSFELEDVADAYDLSPENAVTRAAASKGAFDVQLLPDGAQTRASTEEENLIKAKPSVLASVVVIQKTSTNATRAITCTNITLGTKVTLSSLIEDTDSEITIFAQPGVTASDITAGNWSSYEVKKAKIQAVTSSEQIANMPYLLRLKHVKIVQSGSNYILQSVTGHDVRLRLRRLASRLNVTWDYKVPGYNLQEVSLQNYPMDYAAFPSETEKIYPSTLSQFSSYKATNEELVAKGFSCWMPRNIRGTESISLPTHRGRKKAPPGSSFLRFVAVNQNNPKKQLMYRVYLGANITSDFNVYDNTNYTYHIKFDHSDGELISLKDERVDYQNGISASEDNNSPVPTANCFMVEPGGSFYFDPFAFQTNANPSGSNELLKSWCQSSGISYVKLYWQTKEQGDIGEPVMGYANSETDHTNIVDIKAVESGRDLVQNPATDVGQCNIYCRVNSGTIGGSGLIAAYDKNNDVLWSWHVWVTDYQPDATGNVEVLDDENKRKLKFTSGQLPMMDRNLGAMTGYVKFPPDQTERFRTHGFHYQWGRKDPFPSSYSNKAISSIPLSTTVTEPVDGLLNLYKADGITYLPFSFTANYANNYQEAYGKPQTIFKNGSESQVYWLKSKPKDYTSVWSTKKTVHDPCPAGWRVSQWSEYSALVGKGKQVQNGGILITYSTEKSTYISLAGYYFLSNEFKYIGQYSLLWSGTNNGRSTGMSIDYLKCTSSPSIEHVNNGHEREAITLRCTQESEK